MIDRSQALRDFGALSLTVMVASAAAGALFAWDGFALIGAGAFLAFAIASLLTPEKREMPFLLGAIAVAILMAFMVDDPLRMYVIGLERGVSFSAFILALGFLQAPADGSVMIRRCGEFLIRQGPGRRYMALTAGIHLFGSILNISSLALLGGMVQRSNTLEAAGGDPRVQAIRAQRMCNALLRGFGAGPLWLPSSLTVAVVTSMVPGMSWAQLAPVGIGLAVLVMTIGWVIDRLNFSPRTRTAPVVPASTDNALEVLAPMVGLVVLMLGTIVTVKLATGWLLSSSVIIVVPTVSLAWLSLQYRTRGRLVGLGLALRRFGGHCRHRLPIARFEVLALGSAGFVGPGMAAMLPPDMVGHAIEAIGLPPLALLAILMAVIALLGQISINPAVTVSIVGSAIVQLDPLPAPPLALAVALVGGWALYVPTSPFSSATIICARAFGVSPEMAGRTWNGVFGVAKYALLLVAVGILTLRG